MYWLFKRYMKRFTEEFEVAVKAEVAKGNETVGPNWYTMQQLMFRRKDK